MIVLHTMRFADELVPESELEMARPEKEPSKLEVETAQLLVDQLDSSFEPESLREHLSRGRDGDDRAKGARRGDRGTRKPAGNTVREIC